MLALLVMAGATLSACSPTPEPSPTPTAAFASEEDAFAAAEEVYRAYNDAGNARRSGQPTPDPQDFLIGSALEGDIDALNELRDADLHLEGSVDMALFTGIEADLARQPSQILALVCLDTLGTRVLNGNGEDVTPSNRDSKVAQQVTFVLTEAGLRISAEESDKDAQC